MPTKGYSRVTTEEEDDAAVAQEQQQEQLEAPAALGTVTLQRPLSLSSLPSSLPSLASQLLFTWARPVIDAVPADVGKHVVAEELTMALPASLSAARQVERLEQRRRQLDPREQGTPEARLIGSLHASVREQFWLSGVFRLLAEVANLGSPVLLQWLVESIENKRTGTALLAALLLATAQTANVLLLQQFIYGVFLSGGQVTTSLSAAVFAKAMQLPEDAATAGKVTNLAMKDAASLRNFIVFAHNFWAAPLSVLVSTILLLRCLGWPALAGIALIPALIPIEKRLAKSTKATRKKTLAAADERMVAVRGVVGCIETLKLDPEGWDVRVEKRVGDIRANELAALQGEIELTVQNQVLMRVGPLAVALVAFGVHALAGYELTPAAAFAAVALFSGIGHPFHVLPKCVALLASARASVERLAALLESEEESQLLPQPLVTAGPEPELAITDGEFGVGLPHVVTLRTSPGLNLVLGPTGGGKTAVLRALIGELPPLQSVADGNAAVIRQCVGSTDPFAPLDQRIAYCPETPWLVRDTIQANITIGRGESEEFDADAYEAAIESVSLEADLFALPHGDQTVLGVHGSTVSGGQRARIALARAVYSGARLVVLDHPLAALDVVTAKHCFEHAIGGMRTRGVVVLAASTLAQEWIDSAETVHICRNGGVERCTDDEGDASTLLQEFVSKEKPVPGPLLPTDGVPSTAAAGKVHDRPALTAEQGVAIGEYLRACGRRRPLLAAILAMAAHLLFASKDVVLSAWSDSEYDQNGYLVLYTVLCVAVVAAHWLRFRLFFRMTLRASGVLHAKLFAGVANSPLSFFGDTDAGDITARFAGDTDAIDAQLPSMVSGLMDGILSIFTGLLVVVGAAPVFVIALLPIGLAYWRVARLYRGPAKSLKAMDNQTKAPLLSLMSESLDGIASVRSYQLQPRLRREFCKRLDENNRARYSWDAANRWLSVRLELVGSAIVGAAAVAAVLSAESDEGDEARGGAALAGLAVSSAMFATRSLSYTVRSITGLEQQLNSLQRVVAFAQLEPEPDTVRDPSTAKQQAAIDAWPPEGGCGIELSEVAATYTATTTDSRGRLNALDLTTKHSSEDSRVPVRIHAGQRVGVCGRSGSGKSTLAKVLCRALNCNGSNALITIGGVDSAMLPLGLLRSVVCVVPQVASVGDGGATVRTVIDPAMHLDEQAVWQALTLVGMQRTVAATNKGLDEPVDSGRWSAGEIQLLVLARAVVRQPLVMILDESSAHLDDTAAECVRDLLRYGECFDRTTVIVIAHRLMDVGACDRVLYAPLSLPFCLSLLEVLQNCSAVYLIANTNNWTRTAQGAGRRKAG